MKKTDDYNCGETNRRRLRHPESRRIKVSYLPYRWARIPAGILGFVGVMCALSHRIHAIAAALSFANIPDEIVCYLIVTGACILFGLSLIRTTSESDLVIEETRSADHRPAWRSI